MTSQNKHLPFWGDRRERNMFFGSDLPPECSQPSTRRAAHLVLGMLALVLVLGGTAAIWIAHAENGKSPGRGGERARLLCKGQGIQISCGESRSDGKR